ncbi:MAG: cysteine hydrolase [Clostridia bacterium]|nr:cysteine hydrolase [Clostridia bacterium]
MNFLIVIDMQNDFIDGVLGTKEAVAILPAVKERIKNFNGRVLFTRDTHESDYLSTQEGRNLPVEHCMRDTHGWQINAELDALRKEEPIDKPVFGSVALGQLLKAYDTYEEKIENITLIGVCTDICVISNAMLIKSFLPETPIFVDAACCAGVTPESHERALDAMAVCQIKVLNR